jgi:hypothetical protein
MTSAAFKPRMVDLLGLSLKTWPDGGSRGGTWYYERACIEVKLLYEGIMAVRCLELNLDHFGSGLSGL